MKNHWIDEKKKKALFADLDHALMEAWGDDMTLGEFLASIPNELHDFLMDMELNCPNSDPDTLELGIGLKVRDSVVNP